MFARVILYTDEHIEENLKSEEVATQIGMSRSYFSTRFKEITGDTFHNYVISRKMQAAARKMAKGTENITQIASDLGYDNFYYFTKVFSKEYGCTPTEYAGRLKKCSIWFGHFFWIKKKTVESETISSSEKYDYRINCL